ncbi:putative Glucan 1,3-alpha-glucosidase [uncultured Woeseiaceae bacterium]|uniref:Putative Glucan 1,3-alpha-glucosidase n=1 Tax=uncultured Woeseiaceae bacterium TaxID=1983305 RepID=A0A7D9H5K0_9GAMM|nr:putative Glucan 1,3-alpha-glucosidase [uncultured Woeseiaceae bacterium]
MARRYELPNDQYFGLGIRGGPINRKGRALFFRNSDQAGYGEDALYQSYPFFYTLNENIAHGIFFDNPAYPFFDMNSAGNGIVTFGADQGELDYYIISGPTPFDVANTYSRLTGFNQLPPKWSLGYHHSRYGWLSADEITGIANQLRNDDFPTDTLWFDIDYMDNRQKFSWNPTTFPQPIQLHQSLDALGYKRIYIDEPCIRTDDRLWPYLDAMGYFVKDNTSGDSLVNDIWFGNVSWFDFSKSEASTWMASQIAVFTQTGIDGLWNDLNEPANNFMPDALFDFDGDPRGETESRNLYALLANKAAYEGQLLARPNVRPWNFSRSGYAGIQRYAHTWSGDANSDWPTLRINIEMSISMGLSGQNQFGHDTGGFLGSPDAELFIRWLEFSAFTPLFRNHSINTAAPREPWVYGDPYTEIIRDLIKTRYRFLPYIYSLFETAARTGRPVLTPTFFYASGDVATYSQDHDYLFGPNLLVAPVYEQGATDRSVYLPYGSDWVNFYDGTQFAGGQSVVVDAPLGQTPLFVRTGTILPMGPTVSHTNDGTPPHLDVHIFPGGDGMFVLYEDDGISFDYTSGLFRYTRFDNFLNGDNNVVTITPLAGAYDVGPRDIMLHLIGKSNSPASVLLDSALLIKFENEAELDAANSGWFFNAAASTILIKFPATESAQTVSTL